MMTTRWGRLRALARAAVLGGALLAAAGAGVAVRADTLETVRERGVLLCGVGEESGFAKRGADGRVTGLRADMCRAIAAAAIGDGEAVTFVPLFSGARFDALRDGEIDVLVGGATWTLGREATLGIHFTGSTFYDGQGFIAHRATGFRRLADVTEARVCVVAETTSIENLKAWMRASGKTLTPVELVTSDGSWNTFLGHGCEIMTNDIAGMVMALRDRAPDPDAFVVFPDLISREPLSPAVRNDDPRWETLVRFTFNALVLAEAKGVTQAMAADPAATADDPELRRLLGLEPGIGAPLGLDDGWARRAIAAGGHYGEIFDRNLGAQSRYRMERGLNALWTDGGLLYPLPIR